MKIDVFRACVVSVLLYGAEVWVPKVHEVKRLSGWYNSLLRKIMGIYQKDHKVKNEDLWKRAADGRAVERAKNSVVVASTAHARGECSKEDVVDRSGWLEASWLRKTKTEMD